MNNFFYKFFRFILGPIFKFYYNPEIIGKENLNVEGSFVVTCNHIHLFDQCPIIISSHRTIHYMAKREYFDSFWTRWFFKAVGCISVDRSKKDDLAVSSALSVLNSGGAIGIFPEGTRNKTNKFLLPFKFGAVSLAKKTNSYIIPVGITGDYKFRSKNLVVRIGKPFKVTKDLESTNKKLYKDIEKLMKTNLKHK